MNCTGCLFKIRAALLLKGSANSLWRNLYALLFLLNLSAITRAEYQTATPLLIDKNFTSQSIQENIDYYVDETQTLTITDISLQPQAFSFKSLLEHKPEKNSYRSAIWVRVNLVNQSDELKTIVFHNYHARFNELDFYRADASGNYTEIITGMEFPRETLKTIDQTAKFSVVLNAGEKSFVYFKFRDSQLIPHFTFYAYDQLVYYDSRIVSQAFLSSFYACMVALFGYNLFLAFFSGVNHYKYYVIFMIPTIGVNAMMDGTGFFLLRPTTHYMSVYGMSVAGMVGLFCYLMFARHFMSLAYHYPKLDKIIRLVQYSALALLGLLPVVGACHFESYILGPFNIVVFSFIMYIGIRATKDSLPSASYFLLAEIALTTGALANQLPSNFGLLPINMITIYGLQLGSGGEVMLLAIAIADRIKRLSQEKDLYHAQALQAAESSNHLKNEFLSTISHELRTPMNGVMGNIDLLQDDLLDNKHKGLLKHLSRSADDMMLLIDRILGFTEIHAGQLKLHKNPFGLQSIIQPIIRNYSDRCNAKGLEFIVDIDKSVRDDFNGDSRKLVDVLDALFDNALKFTSAGEINLTIKALTTLNDHSMQLLLFQIKDTGCGIPNEKLGSLFTAFQQGDGSYSREYGGLGLGLAVCRVLAEMLGGTIEIESEEGKGCLVNLRVSLEYHNTSDEDLAKNNIKPQRSRFDVSPRHVLIVEDNATNQIVLKTMVQRLGYEVTIVDNGKQAVDWLDTHKADIVLMDCQMPVMDGFQATRMIRVKPHPVCNIPIVAVTANVLSGDRDLCLEAGMNDYIKKPVSKAVIEEKLHHWLGTEFN